jgi:hypothetical protein
VSAELAVLVVPCPSADPAESERAEPAPAEPDIDVPEVGAPEPALESESEEEEEEAGSVHGFEPRAGDGASDDPALDDPGLGDSGLGDSGSGDSGSGDSALDDSGQSVSSHVAYGRDGLGSVKSGHTSSNGGRLKAELPSDDHVWARAVTSAHHLGPHGISSTPGSATEEPETWRPCELTTSLSLLVTLIENLYE